MLQNSFRKKLENKKTHSYYSISSSLLGFISVYSAFWSFWGHFWPLQRGLIFYGWLLKWTQFRETEGVKWDIFFVVAVIFFLSFFFYWMNKIEYQSVPCSAVKNKSSVAFLQWNRKMDFGQAKGLSIYFCIEVNQALARI